jgi:hypothetical protein
MEPEPEPDPEPAASTGAGAGQDWTGSTTLAGYPTKAKPKSESHVFYGSKPSGSASR